MKRGNKMTATMLDMEFIIADQLTPAQLMEGDYISVNGEIVYVESVTDDATGDTYYVTVTNDFSEDEVIEYNYQDKVTLYALIDLEE
jgi:hypothetical protein